MGWNLPSRSHFGRCSPRMLEFDWVIFLLLCVAAAGLVWVGREEGVTPAASGSSTATVAAFWRHTKSYVAVYSLMMREYVGLGLGGRAGGQHASVHARMHPAVRLQCRLGDCRWACAAGQ